MEIYKFEEQKKKLQGLCDEHNLVFRLRTDSYPMTLTIKPCNGVGEQMSMLERAEEEGYISPEAYLIFVYRDGELTYKTSEVFTINDALFNKLKNIYKKLYYFWLQCFFRTIMESSASGLFDSKYLPKEPEEAGDMAGVNRNGVEPLEDGAESGDEDDSEMPDFDDETSIDELTDDGQN